MRCKECDCCHEVILSKWSPSKTSWVEERVYQCWGVKEPFEISDINHECTEYPERAELQISKLVKTNADRIRDMGDNELAKFLMSRWFDKNVCKNCDGEYDRCGDIEFCTKEILKWLKKTVE